MPGARARRPLWIAGAAAIVAAGFLVPLPVQVLEPGAPVDVSGLVVVVDGPGTGGELLVAHQRSARPSTARVVQALLTQGVDVAGPVRPAQLERAAVIGARAGLGMAGARTTGHDPAVRVNPEGGALDHPDAELAVALAAWLAARGETTDRTVAIGAVAQDGAVSLSGSVHSAAAATRQAGAALVLAPANHVETLRVALDDPSVEVFGVSSVFEAVAAILERGRTW